MTGTRGPSRRGVLAGSAAAVLAGAGLLPERAPRATALATPSFTDLPAGEEIGPLREALATVAPDGVRTVVVTAAPLPAAHPLQGFLSAAYDGQVPGPLLRLRPAERTVVRLHNDLAEPSSLHLHGLQLAPRIDAPLLQVDPGADHAYDVTLPASTGTCWYHPHVHGLVERQMRLGLTGPLLIDPPHLPADVDGTAEAVVVLTHLADARSVLANGHRQPVLRVGPGRVRLRLTNTGTTRSLLLQLHDGTRGPLTMWQVSADTGWLRRPVPRQGLTLPPAGRAEVLVDLPARGCSLLALPREGDTDGGEVSLLATLVGGGALPTALPSGRLSALQRVLPGPRSRRRSIVLGADDDGVHFTIDGRRFDHRRTDLRAHLGSTEVWELRNTTDLEHPFHLHSYPVQVLSINGRRPAFDAWRDVVTVPPRGLVRLSVPLRRYGGLTVFHCHNVVHEDAGMMATLRVT